MISLKEYILLESKILDTKNVEELTTKNMHFVETSSEEFFDMLKNNDNYFDVAKENGKLIKKSTIMGFKNVKDIEKNEIGIKFAKFYQIVFNKTNKVIGLIALLGPDELNQCHEKTFSLGIFNEKKRFDIAYAPLVQKIYNDKNEKIEKKKIYQDLLNSSIYIPLIISKRDKEEFICYGLPKEKKYPLKGLFNACIDYITNNSKSSVSYITLHAAGPDLLKYYTNEKNKFEYPQEEIENNCKNKKYNEFFVYKKIRDKK